MQIWPRDKLLLVAFPNLDNTNSANLFLPIKGDTSFEYFKGKEEEFLDFMYHHFPDVVSKMTGKWGLVESFRHCAIGRVVDIRCYPWTINNFCLIGDAAHAVFPFYGQGLN